MEIVLFEQAKRLWVRSPEGKILQIVLLILKNFLLEGGDVLVAPDTSSVIRTSAEMQVFRRLVQASFDHAPTRWDAEREEEIVVALLTCATAGADSDTSTANSRARAAARALAYLREQPEEVVTVADICVNTGVALRTLNRAFREYFGVGPKAYLTRERLSRVRAELVRAPRETLIADVANRHGFWHLGQFARDYRRLFGELPSETSRQSLH